MGRAPCCDKANVKKGPWSPEEDAKLKAYIEQHGTGGNWIALPQKIGLKRCGKSCRLRWLNYLRPNIKHGGFTEEEENIICSMATVQCETIDEFSCEQQTAMDECLKEAESQFSDKTTTQSALRGSLLNLTKGKGNLSLMHLQRWVGIFDKEPPKNLHKTGSFLQVNHLGNRCQAAVVYAGKNHSGVDCGWLVAWNNNTKARQVYVECGPRNNYDDMNWNDIKSKVESSGWRGKYTDPSTGTTVIGVTTNKSGKNVVGATFFG